MRGPNQRRGFIRREWSPGEVYAELDYIHQILNGFTPPKQLFQDYQVTVYDTRLACMQPALTLRLPVLRQEDDGWTIYIQDRSGDAAVAISIIAPPGFLINNTTAPTQTVTLTTAYQGKTIQWDFKNNAYYEIS